MHCFCSSKCQRAGTGAGAGAGAGRGRGAVTAAVAHGAAAAGAGAGSSAAARGDGRGTVGGGSVHGVGGRGGGGGGGSPDTQSGLLVPLIQAAARRLAAPAATWWQLYEPAAEVAAGSRDAGTWQQMVDALAADFTDRGIDPDRVRAVLRAHRGYIPAQTQEFLVVPAGMDEPGRLAPPSNMPLGPSGAQVPRSRLDIGVVQAWVMAYQGGRARLSALARGVGGSRSSSGGWPGSDAGDDYDASAVGDVGDGDDDGEDGDASTLAAGGVTDGRLRISFGYLRGGGSSSGSRHGTGSSRDRRASGVVAVARGGASSHGGTSGGGSTSGVVVVGPSVTVVTTGAGASGEARVAVERAPGKRPATRVVLPHGY